MATETSLATKPPFYRNVRVLRVAAQVVSVGLVFWFLWWMGNNLITNLERQGIRTDFGFLSQPTNFQIAYSDFDSRAPVIEMVWVGVKNTFLAGLFGILLASVAGLLIGIGRLSQNWLVSKFSMVYVEFFRNIPPLVVLTFVGFAIFTFGPFPILRESIEIGSDERTWFLINNTQWGVPWFEAPGGAGGFLVFLGAGIVGAFLVGRWRTRLNERTGTPHHRVLWSLGVLALAVTAGQIILDYPVAVSFPSLSDDGRVIEGGIGMNSGFLSVAIALGLYTASHIAEIIRGSILAVPRGQSEAADALALSGFQRYRFVVLPQAMRIAIPPVINQFLNLVKNTSLAPAVAYAEITALTITSIGNGRPAPQSIIILMAVYLTFSLAISLILNVVNRRLQLVTT